MLGHLDKRCSGTRLSSSLHPWQYQEIPKITFWIRTSWNYFLPRLKRELMIAAAVYNTYWQNHIEKKGIFNSLLSRMSGVRWVCAWKNNKRICNRINTLPTVRGESEITIIWSPLRSYFCIMRFPNMVQHMCWLKIVNFDLGPVGFWTNLTLKNGPGQQPSHYGSRFEPNGSTS